MNRIKLVYLLAASHSGSTLLALLLGSHPDVCTVGEIKMTALGDLDQYRCSCRQPIMQCSFWNAISKNMGKRGLEFDLTRPGTHFKSQISGYVNRLLKPLHRGPALEWFRDLALAFSPAWRKELPKIMNQNRALLECISEQTGRNVIVDSSKIGLRLKYLLREPSIDIRVVRLVRDGRAVSLTYVDPARFADAKDPNFRGGGSGGDRHCEQLAMASAAREWKRSNEEAESILNSLDPSQWIRIHYEELCAAPEATLSKVFSFLGLPINQISSDFRSAGNHIVGNGMRLDSTSEISLDERWRTELNAADLATFNSVAGRVNEALGYI